MKYYGLEGYSVNFLDIADATPPPCGFNLPGLSGAPAEISTNTVQEKLQQQAQNYWQYDRGGPS